jgi:hypothetical protein
VKDAAHVCFAFCNDPGTFRSRHKIVLPSDIKGDKVREVLERGVATTIGFPWQSIILFGIDKVSWG